MITTHTVPYKYSPIMSCSPELVDWMNECYALKEAAKELKEENKELKEEIEEMHISPPLSWEQTKKYAGCVLEIGELKEEHQKALDLCVPINEIPDWVYDHIDEPEYETAIKVSKPFLEQTHFHKTGSEAALHHELAETRAENARLRAVVLPAIKERENIDELKERIADLARELKTKDAIIKDEEEFTGQVIELYWGWNENTVVSVPAAQSVFESSGTVGYECSKCRQYVLGEPSLALTTDSAVLCVRCDHEQSEIDSITGEENPNLVYIATH